MLQVRCALIRDRARCCTPGITSGIDAGVSSKRVRVSQLYIIQYILGPWVRDYIELGRSCDTS